MDASRAGRLLCAPARLHTLYGLVFVADAALCHLQYNTPPSLRPPSAVQRPSISDDLRGDPLCTTPRVLNAVDCFTVLSLLAYVNKHLNLQLWNLSAVLAGGTPASKRSHASGFRVLQSR